MRHSKTLLIVVLGIHTVLFIALSNTVIFREKKAVETIDDVGFSKTALVVLPKKENEDDNKPSAEPADAPPPIPTVIHLPNPVSVIAVAAASNLGDFKVMPPTAPLPNVQQFLTRVARSSGGGGLGAHGSGFGGKAITTNLFGMEVSTSGPLMAFIDTSESLKDQHDLVVNEIRKQLPDCVPLEINGGIFSTRSSLEHARSRESLPSYYVEYYISMVDGSIIPRITDAVINKKIADSTSIYYFSDFQDYSNPNDVNEFSKLLQEHDIHFYAHSVGEEPSSEIRQLCDDTHGAWTVKKLK